MPRSIKNQDDVRALTRRAGGSRRGATAVEFAIVAPIFFFLLFTSLEFVRAHNLIHTADEAAYEGARRGIVPGANAVQIRDACNFVLGSVGARGTTIRVTPNVITPFTQSVTVDVEIPLNANGLVTPLFFRDRVIRSSLTMEREEFSQSTTP